MALIKCPECGRENVSDSAESCPECGYGIKAHYIKIRQDEARKERERIAEEEKRVREEKAARAEKEEYDNIKMPKKPQVKTSTIIALAIAWVAVIGLSMLGGSFHFGAFVIMAIIVAIPTWVQVWAYNVRKEMYDLAQRDVDAYKRKMIQNRRELEESKKQTQTRHAQEINAKVQANMIKCPHCGSYHTNRISTTNRAVSVATVGLASGKIGKQYQCRDCKHMW